MTEAVVDRVKHGDTVGSSSRHLPRPSHEYGQIYVKSSLGVFWAICLLFLFNMAMPAKSIEFKPDNGGKIKEQLSQIENGAAEFKNKGFTLTTYGKIEGSPIPVLRYLKALEKAVNPGSGTLDVEFDREGIEKTVMKIKELGVTKTTFEVEDVVDVARAAVRFITKSERGNGESVVETRYVAYADIPFVTPCGKYLVRLNVAPFAVKEEDVDLLFGAALGCNIILEQPSVFAQHLMSYALGGAYTADTYMAAVRDPDEGVILIAAGVVCEGEKVNVSGMTLAPAFVHRFNGLTEVLSSPVDTLINFLNKGQNDESAVKCVEEAFGATWVKKTFGKDIKKP
eukprot:GHVS01060605.1.p1 GENE.GHVS01060605.1~~GHVS01060605.1.p1  ORF type:complete len:340 (+),score=30.95 GHVS01060605.1:216-1235(+)